MFGVFRRARIHEPIEKQREEAVACLPEPFRVLLGAQYLNGLDCDRLPAGRGPFGTLANPIPVNGCIGEIKYLVKLRGRSGEPLMFHRLGCVGSPATRDLVDCFEVVCMDDTQWNRLYLDCCHPRRSNRSPSGYRLAPFSALLGADLPYGFGCDSMVPDFPHGLPCAIIRRYGSSPGDAFARRVEERLKKHPFRRPVAWRQQEDALLAAS